MKVLVIGANGQIGSILVNKFNENNSFEALAGVRKEEQMKKYEDQGVNPVFVDLEGSIADMEESMQDADAVVFAAGSGGSTGPEKTVMVDLDGAIKSMEAAKNAGIKRFVIVSAYNSDNREYWSYNMEDSSIGNYYFASKYYADEWLKNLGLDYTILRPTLLSNDPGTGEIILTENFEPEDSKPEVTREDVADTIVAVLESDNTVGKAFDLSHGSQSIGEAVSKA